MTTAKVLATLRRYLEEVDQATSDYTDEELLDAVEDARADFELRKLSGMEALTVEPDQAAGASYGITPEPSLEQGHMLALAAAVRVLRRTYQGRLLRGELGVAWRSGLEEESSIQAAQAYRRLVNDLEQDLAEWVLVKRAPTSATRPQ